MSTTDGYSVKEVLDQLDQKVSGKLDRIADQLSALVTGHGLIEQRVKVLETARTEAAGRGWQLLLTAITGNVGGAVALLLQLKS